MMYKSMDGYDEMTKAADVLTEAISFLTASDKKIVILRGIPGCGKSTIAKWAGSIAGAISFSADHYFMKSGEYKFDPLGLNAAHADCQRKFKSWALMAAGGAAVVDNTNLSLRELNTYINIAKTHNIKYEIWSIAPQADLARTLHGVPEDSMVRMLGKFNSSEPEVAKLAGYRSIKQEVVNLTYNQQ